VLLIFRSPAVYGSRCYILLLFVLNVGQQVIALRAIVDIVTSCRHIGNLLGKPSITGNQRIKKWIETGNFSIKDVTRFTKTSSESEAALLIDTYKREKVKGIHLYSRAQKGVKTHLGKKMVGLESEGWEYKI
jgi:hypothetical protein